MKALSAAAALFCLCAQGLDIGGHTISAVYMGTNAVSYGYVGGLLVFSISEEPEPEPDPTLIGFWPLADNADDYVVADVSASGNNGTASAFTSVLHTSGPGSPGPVSALGIVNPETVAVPGHSAYSVFADGPFTVCAWVQPPVSPSTYVSVFGQVDGWLVYVTAMGPEQYLSVYDGSLDYRDPRLLTPGAWYFVAATVYSGTCVMYVDAVAGAPFGVPSLPDNSNNYLIGNDLRIPSPAGAAIAGVRVYSRVLSTDDMATIMAGGEPPPGDGAPPPPGDGAPPPPPTTITVTFDPGYGYASYTSAEYTIGAAFGDLPTAESYEPGYVFSYWRDADYNTYYVESVVPGSDMTLYAEYYYSP